MIDIDYIKARVKEQDLIAITREEDDPSDIIQEDRISTAIEDAVADVVAHWGDKYYYPWTFEDTDMGEKAKDRLERIHFDLARYYLYSLKYDDEEIKHIKARYEKALEILKGYSNLHNAKLTEKDFPGLTKLDGYTAGISLDSIITNKTAEDKKLHGIFEVNS